MLYILAYLVLALKAAFHGMAVEKEVADEEMEEMEEMVVKLALL